MTKEEFLSQPTYRRVLDEIKFKTKQEIWEDFSITESLVSPGSLVMKVDAKCIYFGQTVEIEEEEECWLESATWIISRCVDDVIHDFTILICTKDQSYIWF